MFSPASSAFPRSWLPRRISSDLNVTGPPCSSFPAPLRTDCFKFACCICVRAFGRTLRGVCVCVCLYSDAYTPSSAYVHFNLKSRLVAMETPTSVPLVGNNGLAYCTLYFIALQTSRQHLSTLQHIQQCGEVYVLIHVPLWSTTFKCVFISNSFSEILHTGSPLHVPKLLACTTGLWVVQFNLHQIRLVELPFSFILHSKKQSLISFLLFWYIGEPIWIP